MMSNSCPTEVVLYCSDSLMLGGCKRGLRMSHSCPTEVVFADLCLKMMVEVLASRCYVLYNLQLNVSKSPLLVQFSVVFNIFKWN